MRTFWPSFFTHRCGAALAATAALLAGCSSAEQPTTPAAPGPPKQELRTDDCNGITDADVTRVAGAGSFTRVMVSEAGCFWQENTVFGSVGAGMGVSTWWYRGSDISAERALEEQSGRTLTELSIDGNTGFQAYDTNACSTYLTEADDVFVWSVQTMNPATLPGLCSITEQLAQVSQHRVN